MPQSGFLKQFNLLMAGQDYNFDAVFDERHQLNYAAEGAANHEAARI